MAITTFTKRKVIGPLPGYSADETTYAGFIDPDELEEHEEATVGNTKSDSDDRSTENWPVKRGVATECKNLGRKESNDTKTTCVHFEYNSKGDRCAYFFEVTKHWGMCKWTPKK